MKNLNMKKFKEMSPCMEGYEFVLSLKTTDLRTIFDALNNHNLEWSNWLITRLFNRKDRIRYAIFAARQVLEIFEKKCLEDLRPRQAIEAAIVCIENNTKKTRAAARAAGDAAWAAAGDAAWADWAAARAAAGADWAAARAAGDAMKLKIVNYGLELLGVK